MRRGVPALVSALFGGKVLMHSMIIGELACGNLQDRKQQLMDWQTLPKVMESSNEDVIAFLEQHQLMGRGIGFVDAHLLCAVAKHNGALLWTRDRPLKKLAKELGLVHPIGV